MADRPILFSAPMVRALLAGTKTQTRRVLKGAWQHALEGHDEVLTWFAPAHVPKEGIINEWAESGIWARKHGPRGYNRHLGYVPFRPGCRLWVRETLRRAPHMWTYAADGEPIGWPARGDLAGKVRDYIPSIHMPRWASRLTLIVTEVRVQRLHDISEEDAVAEGVERLHHGWFPYGISTFMTTVVDGREVPAQCCRTALQSYQMLWNTINGAGAWDKNPWIAAYTFTVHQQNIDSDTGGQHDRS